MHNKCQLYFSSFLKFLQNSDNDVKIVRLRENEMVQNGRYLKSYPDYQNYPLFKKGIFEISII